MNGVIGMTEILKQTKLTDDQKEFVSIIESSAGSLLNVINDILDFSKIESNKIEVESISFHIRKVVEDVGDTLLLHVNKKGINLLVYIDPEIPDVVTGDPVRLRQVILNLANNAVKFTSEGEVVISAELIKDDNAKDKNRVTILFKVKDTGIGISKEGQKRLFEAFSQADSTINRKYGGTGLGLTISKRLVELMGGELMLESEVGKGSEFFFKLSFEVGNTTVGEYFTETEDLSRLRVLILDDNESNRIIFKKYFGYWNIHADEASDVDEAVAMVKKAIENHATYNLILVDFQMPGKSGLDFGDILLKENLKKNTKLILFSSISDMIDANTIFKHGFDSYLYKPVKYHPFRKIVFETINKQVEYKLKDSGVIEGKKEEKTKEKKKNFDIKILLAEDNIINQKVATVTLNKLGFKNVDVANNGTEAVQMHLKNHYDLILMDIQMPVMNGLEATGKIRENERDNNKLKRVKIIALTANALESDVKMYLQHDMDDVLTKPFKPADLKRIIG
jgi:CheY-like chemotaxis protein/two-component sensor histidine kinase